MTTPFGMASTPTPKQFTSTPSKPSPRFSGKTIGKSPAVKTPMTNHAHSHKISISSHPTLTPLANTHLPDDILNMSTPAAMLAMSSNLNMNMTMGITPLPTDSFSNMPYEATSPQHERYDRLRAISRTLKAAARGRGVSRHNVRTLARVHGFEPLWQDDVLTLAGQQFVEMEIEFHKRSERVCRATLTLNEDEDSNVQEQAGVVLTRNLTQKGEVWCDLEAFQENLVYLSHMEGVGANAFQVVDGFHEMLKKVWEEEKRRIKWRGEPQQICQSNVGKPAKDVERLGVSCEFWCDGVAFSSSEEKQSESIEGQTWTARFALEKGQGLQIPEKQNWVGEEVLENSARAEDIFDELIDRPAWADGDTSKMLDVHFVAEIDPAILVSVPGVQTLNKNGQMTSQETLQKVTTFQTLITEEECWIKSSFVPHEERKYQYNFNPQQGLWAFEVSKLMFAHPRQYTEALPVLRQYALINTLLKSIKPDTKTESSAISGKQAEVATVKTEIEGTVQTLVSRPRTYHRSNRRKVEDELDALMKDKTDGSVPVSITLDTHSSPAGSARLTLKVAVSPSTTSKEMLRKVQMGGSVSVSIDILLNGIVQVVGFQDVELDEQREEELKKRLAKVVRASEDIGMIVTWILMELGQL